MTGLLPEGTPCNLSKATTSSTDTIINVRRLIVIWNSSQALSPWPNDLGLSLDPHLDQSLCVKSPTLYRGLRKKSLSAQPGNVPGAI